MIPNRKLSKAETKAYSTYPILTKEDGNPIDVSELTQGVDYEITTNATVTTEPIKVKRIAQGRQLHADGVLKSFDNMSAEEAKRIRQNGQESMMKIKRQRKSIHDICNTILSIDAEDIAEHVVDKSIADKLKGTGLTLYDLMVAKMVEESMHGNVKAFSAVRDSAGDKPIDKSEVTAEVVTDADREMMERIAKRLDK